MNQKYDKSLIKTRNDELREELKNLSSMQAKIEQMERDKKGIQDLMVKAPAHIQEQVLSIMNSSSKYLNLKGLRDQLEKGKFSEIKTGELIDKDALLKDMAKGDLV
jgi:hypothetical protein